MYHMMYNEGCCEGVLAPILVGAVVQTLLIAGHLTPRICAAVRRSGAFPGGVAQRGTECRESGDTYGEAGQRHWAG